MTEDPHLKRWNERYSAEDYVFGTEPNAFLASNRELLAPGQRALAVADGEGRNGVWLARQGLRVLSIDFSSAALEKARRLAERHGVTIETELADLRTWDWGEDRFDLVVAIFVQFAPPAERARMFENMKRCLKPGGLLILQGYTPKQIEYKTGGPPDVENLYTAALLRQAFADMTIVHLREHEDVIEEGERHKGLSALVDLVARK
jgi:cyclopropane fatty-acyl-phospholipid synthase-like methyltransferase